MSFCFSVCQLVFDHSIPSTLQAGARLKAWMPHSSLLLHPSFCSPIPPDEAMQVFLILSAFRIMVTWQGRITLLALC